MPQIAPNRPFSVSGNSTCGKCDYFKIKGHEKEYFIVTELYTILFLPPCRIRQYIATKPGDRFDSRIEVCVVLTEVHRISVILAYLRTFIVVGSVITFFVAVAISFQTEIWWKDFIAWTVCLTYVWCFVLFVGFFKHKASQENTEKYTRLVVGETVSALHNNRETGEAENVQVQLETGTNDQPQTEAKQPIYSYDQLADENPPSVHHI